MLNESQRKFWLLSRMVFCVNARLDQNLGRYIVIRVPREAREEDLCRFRHFLTFSFSPMLACTTPCQKFFSVAQSYRGCNRLTLLTNLENLVVLLLQQPRRVQCHTWRSMLVRLATLLSLLLLQKKTVNNDTRYEFVYVTNCV